MIRPAREGDADALAQIYGWHCRHGAGTFEETPPDAAAMGLRMSAVLAHGLPYRVVEQAGEVVAFACAAPFRLRGGYRYTAEDSVYVRHDRRGRGLGKAVLAEVVEVCKHRGLHQLVALIGGSDNAASIGLHQALGFGQRAVLPNLGFKDGRLVDVVWMQLELGAPRGEGLVLE
ncbi:MAG: GCN5-related N-acetyltransferase [Caulobacteraceae bacterium]|nr:GCN5-related N-acetyltransferase [Caulobacteraceae bacterium]